jgi:hypothetical protein
MVNNVWEGTREAVENNSGYISDVMTSNSSKIKSKYYDAITRKCE